MTELTRDQLVTVLQALECYAITHVNAASRNAHAATLDYVLGGGERKPVVKAQELIAVFAAELERRKAEQ